MADERRGAERYAKTGALALDLPASPVAAIDAEIASIEQALAGVGIPQCGMHERDVWAARCVLHALYRVRRAVTG